MIQKNMDDPQNNGKREAETWVIAKLFAEDAKDRGLWVRALRLCVQDLG